jgi:hypothetical protein
MALKNVFVIRENAEGQLESTVKKKHVVLGCIVFLILIAASVIITYFAKPSFPCQNCSSEHKTMQKNECISIFCNEPFTFIGIESKFIKIRTSNCFNLYIIQRFTTNVSKLSRRKYSYALCNIDKHK